MRNHYKQETDHAKPHGQLLAELELSVSSLYALAGVLSKKKKKESQVVCHEKMMRLLRPKGRLLCSYINSSLRIQQRIFSCSRSTVSWESMLGHSPFPRTEAKEKELLSLNQ